MKAVKGGKPIKQVTNDAEHTTANNWARTFMQDNDIVNIAKKQLDYYDYVVGMIQDYENELM